MRLLFEAAVLCLTLGLGHSTEDTTQENAAHQSSSTESYFPEWGIGAIRDSFETVNSYFDSFLEHCQVLEKLLLSACESVADTVFNAVWTLGCRPFMNSQRSACICSEEERDEL